MKAGQIKIFKKSGNKVILIERDTPESWVVERVEGKSKGKLMICKDSALLDINCRGDA